MKKIICLFCVSLLFTSCLKSEKTSEKVSSCGANEFFESEWTYALETYPTFASSRNYGERHNEFFQNTPENLEKEYQRSLKTLEKAEAMLSDESCSSRDLENLELFIHGEKDGIEEYKFKTRFMVFSSRGGPHVWMPQMYKRFPLKTVQNYKDYVERMSKVPNVFARAKALSLRGLKEGLTPPKATFKNYETTFTDLSSGDPEKSPFFGPFKDFPASFSAEEKEMLKKSAIQTITERIQPAYADLHQFWVKEYFPKLRTSIGASELPNGKAFYDYRVRKFTTLDYTAKEVHEIGKKEVARLLGEMKEIKKKVGFTGDLKSFFKELRTNPKFYAKSKEDLLKETTFILKNMDGKLPQLFKTLPRLTYSVEPIPDFIAHKAPAAYYQHGNAALSKAGTYQINLSNLPSRPLYNLEALSLHEAVPGHHLQIAIAQEIEGLPEFRKQGGFTAFVEGWGLYSESLGKLVGMYKDPYSDFGRLTYEQWRAMRLVVDTGIHAFGWSRQKAIDYMTENSGLSVKNIITEVDRYINMPGQALAYKMGELKIKELRALSEKELGDKYDIREFHDVVLGSGGVPLKLLEKNVKAFIAKIKKESI